ncbi:MAG TPA: HPF/RaiA family ribosome-associated protein [Flavihumibacter sp.]|jgi:ribosomal subunit interface protein
MKIRIESPSHKISPSLKSFATEKISGLERIYKDIQEVEITLVNEVKGSKEVVLCTLNIRVPGKDEYVKAKSYIFEDAILKAVDAAKARLRIRKTKLQAARKKKLPNRTLNNKSAKAK